MPSMSLSFEKRKIFSQVVFTRLSPLRCLPPLRRTHTVRENTKMESNLKETKLVYFNDMWSLRSKSTLLSYTQEEDGRNAVILESTIFHPQGGGQPYDTGYISNPDSNLKFIVQDVRLIHGQVFHYGNFENSENECDWKEGIDVCLFVDEQRRSLNSRIHSAGHLLDICMRNIGLDYLEPGKGYHFPDGPFVEYKGSIPQSELQVKQKELELNANALISEGGMIYAAVLTYEEAAKLCGGELPDYIAKIHRFEKQGFVEAY